MKRIHLFELEDQSWFPKIIRDAMTDYLQFVADRFDFYHSVIHVVKKGLSNSGGNQIVDLASGGGGGLLKVAEHLREDYPELRIVLTDFYPNQTAFESIKEKAPTTFRFESSSIDARNVPRRLTGLRTQFLSFHHFRRADAMRILQNAVDTEQPIAIFEVQKRNLEHLIKFSLSPIGVWVTTPFIRPFRWSRILFTYLIPIIPICVFWDGLVSVLRTYSIDEMQSMVREVDPDAKYEWEIDEQKSASFTIPYLLGYPKKD